jgi:rsbT co-antagonist protein RsbR
MAEQLRIWLGNLPYHDIIVRRQATLLQWMALGLVGIALLFLPFPLLTIGDPLGRAAMTALIAVVALLSIGTLLLIRHGRAQAAAMLMALGLVAVLSTILYLVSLRYGSVVLFSYSLPIAIGGLLVGRRGLLLVLATAVLGVSLVGWLEQIGAPGSGLGAVGAGSPLPTVLSFALIGGLLGLFIERISTAVGAALAAQRLRERELETLSRRLEASVRERTADLEMALGNLEQRAGEQERLIEANRRQAAVIRELSVPVLPLNEETLVMPLVGALDDERLILAQEQALERLERSRARTLLLDITGVPVVDTFVARGLLHTVQAARLLGAEVALVGVRPEVAQALVGLGVDFGLLHTYADLRTALSRLTRK